MIKYDIKVFIFGLRNLIILGIGLSITLFLLSYLYPLMRGYNPKFKDFSQTLSFPYAELASGASVLFHLIGGLIVLMLGLALIVMPIMYLGSLSVPLEKDD